MTVTYPIISEGFLLDEDNALRRYLMGLYVSDDEVHERPVGVWYAHPDLEIREQRYPYIVISLIDISEAPNRVHSGDLPLQSIEMSWLSKQIEIELVETPDGIKVYNAAGLWTDVWMDPPSVPLRFSAPAPVPVQIDYQVRAFSRHPRHDRAIIKNLLGRRIPYRYGILNMEDIDGSVRRMELLDFSHGESVESEKRLFVSVFTVRVDSFMPVGEGMIDVIEDQYVMRVYLDIDAAESGPLESHAFDKEWVPFEALVAEDGEFREHWMDREPASWQTYDRPSHYTLPQHETVGGT